ncbi:MAG: ADP-ribosylglycohydrolase family protein [Armatimonadetes bacterium]|nr:ADP-ribosylglycohydrolase family protein [Armatimonadota bacterium]
MSVISIAARVRGAFLTLASGDALGAPGEFSPAASVFARWRHITDYVSSGTWDAGEWTDDTAMALRVAQGIVAARGGDPVPAIGEGFLEWYRSKPKDVGNTISGVLGTRRIANSWASASRSSFAAQSGMAGGNGSLMRTLPVALAYTDEARMLRQSARISAMTHWDAHAEACCAVYCLWVRNLLTGQERLPAWNAAVARARELAPTFPSTDETPGIATLSPVTHTPLLRGGDPVPFWEFLESVPTRAVADLQPSGYAGYVVECLEAAVVFVLTGESLEETLIATANMGGESDTVGAVAGGAAGAYWGEPAIPARWLTGLLERENIENTANALATYRAEHDTETLRAASDAVYAAHPGLPAFDYRAIGDTRLWHGRNPLTAWDVERLRADGITHVLDLRQSHEWGDGSGKVGGEAVAALAGAGSAIARKHIALPDGGIPGDAEFGEAIAFLQTTLSDPDARVYVHCRLGRERTGAILAAYHAKAHGVSADEAVEALNGQGARLSPTGGQMAATREWVNRSA